MTKHTIKIKDGKPEVKKEEKPKRSGKLSAAIEIEIPDKFNFPGAKRHE